MRNTHNGLEMENISIYKVAADCGLYMGAWMSAIFLAMAYATSVPGLSLIAIALLIGLPFFLFRIMRRYQRLSTTHVQMSALWMLGMMSCIFGGILLAAAVFIFLRFIDPEFIYRQLGQALEVYNQNKELVDPTALKMLNNIYENRQIPSAIQSAMSMMWCASFFGSILSLFEALIATATYRKKPQE